VKEENPGPFKGASTREADVRGQKGVERVFDRRIHQERLTFQERSAVKRI